MLALHFSIRCGKVVKEAVSINGQKYEYPRIPWNYNDSK